MLSFLCVLHEAPNAYPVSFKPIGIWVLDCLQMIFSASFICTATYNNFAGKKKNREKEKWRVLDSLSFLHEQIHCIGLYTVVMQ